MTTVKEVFITKEAADQLGISTQHLIRKGKDLLNDDEMREAGKRNYLFTKEGIEKIRRNLKG